MMTDAANASQQHQQQPPPVMAHYKFHNDCQSSVLTYDQVKRLDQVIDQVVPIHGRGNFPTLYVRLKELVRLVKAKLQNEHSIEIRDIRLNGGAANYVLAPENSHYNDLDLVFGTDLSDESRFDVIRDVVLECLMEFYPSNKTTNSTTAIQASTAAAAAAAADGLNQQVDRNTSETRNGNPSDSNKRDSYATSTSTTATTTNNTTTTIEAKQHDQVPERTCAGFGKDQVNGDPQASTKSARTPQVHHLDRSDTSDHQLPNSNENQQHHQHQNLIDALDCSSLKLSPSTAPPAFNNNQHVGPYYQMPLNNCAFKEAYVHKMVKVTDDDRWSLISLGVQQSEAGCCHQQPVFSRACNHCCPTTAASIDSQKVVLCSACPPICANSQYIDANLRPSPNFDGPTMCPNCPAHDDAKCHLYSGALTAVQPCEAAPLSQTHHQYHHHQQQHCLDSYCYGQPKQLPNSIELKFVDRMRRKFEFSVDSFQIILDSLIQFYDYAPQSTITIQRQPNNACCQMISKMNANFRVSLDNNRCTGCYCHDLDSNYKSNDDEVSYLSEHNREAHSDDIQESKAAKNNNNNKNLSGTKDKRKRQRSTVVNCAHGYYQLESRCSHSDGSVASSSGCSSSSSVASSSSSSLSYDDDNEDLYGDADSPASSSASTSSLISSTASSIYSNERRCDTTTIHDRCGNCNLRYQEAEHGQEVYNNAHQNLGLPMTFESSATQMSEFVECCLECEQQKQQYGRNYCQFNLSNCGKSDSETRRSSCAVISENFYPTVIGRSEYGNFKEALYHLERKLIATKSPEEIRGGGLLKYCNLLVKNYKATNIYQIRTLERYMCSRFFIDFSDLNQQRAKLESYLANHFSDDPMQKFNYLKILHTVVRRSTVCLMNHELRLILGMILELACKLEEQQKSQHASAVAAIQSQHQLSTPPPATTPTPSPAPPVSSSASLYSHQPKQQRSQQASQYAPAAAPLRCDKQQQQPIYYQQQKPISFEAGPYKVKLVNYAISKQPVRSKV